MNSGWATPALFVYWAALAAFPCSQAAKNSALVSLTSSLDGGPVFTLSPLASEPPAIADTMLNAPYPAPPTITANTPPTMAVLAPCA